MFWFSFGLAALVLGGCSGANDDASVQVTTAEGDVAPRCFAKDLTDEFGLGDCDQGHSSAAGGGGDDDPFGDLGTGGADGSWTKRNPQPKSAGSPQAPGGDCADGCKDDAESCVSICESTKTLAVASGATIAACKSRCAVNRGRCMTACLGRIGLH